MTAIILFAVLAGMPIINALLMRVSAVFLFASIAVGNFLVLYLSDDVILAVNAFTKGQHVPMITQLTLLLLPILLTLFFLRKTMPKSKFLLHIVPLIGCGLSIAVLALPLLPSEVQGQIFDLQSGGAIFKNSQDLIISLTSIMVLMLMWQTYRPHEGKHGKKHH